jgi:hypothetical protein
MMLPLVFSALNLRKNAFLLAAAFISVVPPTAATQIAAPYASNKPPEWDVVSVKSIKPAYDG